MEILRPLNIRNKLYYSIGAIFITLNYIRHNLFGYRTPRTFSIKQIEQSIGYDLNVVEKWIRYLDAYSGKSNFLNGKTILELGPGPDLGTGLILLAMGAKKYIALDINKLADAAASEFYNKLLDKIQSRFPASNSSYLKTQLEKTHKGEDSNIEYIVDKDFDVSKINDRIDIIFSQAVFEHFTNTEKVLRDLGSIVKNGSILVSEVDLKTHTGWIRDRDPLNIYRYNDWFWDSFKFKGSPNRITALEYKRLLEKNGWHNVRIEPLAVLNADYLSKVKQSLNKKFQNKDSSEMAMLSIMLMATKA